MKKHFQSAPQDAQTRAFNGSRRVHRAHAAAARPAAAKAPVPAVPAAAPKTTHWGSVAEWYDGLVGEDGSEYHQEVILPGLLKLLNIDLSRVARKEAKRSNAAPLKVLDIASGQGVLCRKLAEAGCDVTGIDAAAPLIEAAERRNAKDALPIRYTVGDATQLLDGEGRLLHNLALGSFDAVTIVLAIQNISRLSPVWKACHAALKPGGQLILVMMHPCFRVPKASDWLWEEGVLLPDGKRGAGRQSRVLRKYLSSSPIPIQTHPGKAASSAEGGQAETTHFHRPLQAYINTLGNSGLLIDHIDEWISHKTSQAGPRKASIDAARREFPMFLALSARKIAGITPSTDSE